MADALAARDQFRSLRKAGWFFLWEPDTGFVVARHPKGGLRSVLEIRADDFRSLGPFIADWLNEATAHG